MAERQREQKRTAADGADALAQRSSGTGFLDRLRSETYPNWRNKIAATALDLGGASTAPEAKQLLHEGGNYALTKMLGKGDVIPPWLAANFSDAAYLGNETFTGSLAALTGRPFESDYGFRWGDVALNRHGQDRAMAELEAENAIANYKRQEVSRGWRGIPAYRPSTR
jgi:hypothetical protein